MASRSADSWHSTSCRAHGKTLAWSRTRRSPRTRATSGLNNLTGEILPFPGVSDLSYNASLYYETDKFSIRTAYNWRESWLITPNGRGGWPEFNGDYGTLDASASWNINDNFTAFFDVVNLLDEQRVEFNNPNRFIGNETFGKRMFLGVRAKF